MAVGPLGEDRLMYIIIVKFIEVFTRAVFVIAGTYALKLEGSGQFGLIVTLIGLFAFAFNFERQYDIQRRVVDEAPAVFDRKIMDALYFYVFNYVLMLPIFILATAFWTHISWLNLGLCAVIVICEHLCNQCYQFTLVSPRYRHLMTAVAIKNVVVMLLIVWRIFLSHHPLDLTFALLVWSFASALCVLCVAIMWWRMAEHSPRQEPLHFDNHIFDQHRASLNHFSIGLMAILMLQFDRLAVGKIMSLSDTGIYFRHVLIASFAYQFFNIASFNRILPGVFATAKTRSLSTARHRVQLEMILLIFMTGLGFAALLLGDMLTHHVYLNKYSLQLPLMGLVLIGFLVRAGADLNGLLYHATMNERHLLKMQAIAFALYVPLMIVLTFLFGMYGAVAATISAAALYLMQAEAKATVLVKGKL